MQDMCLHLQLETRQSGSMAQARPQLQGCTADDISQKGTQGVCVMLKVLLKYFCHDTKAKLHETEVSDVEITLSEPLLFMWSAQAPTFC